MARSLAVAAEFLLWCGICVGIWLLTLSSLPSPDVMTAAGASIPCAAVAVAARRIFASRWHPRVRWLGVLAVLPVAIAADTLRLFRLLGRREFYRGEVGRFAEVHLPAGEREPVAAARRVLSVFAVSVTPGTYVVDTRPEDGLMVVHRLLDGPPDVISRVRT